MMSRFGRVLRREAGQAIAILAISGAALLTMVALVVDGGTAFAQQRIAQNAADAASEAGAVVLLQKLVGVAPAKTDLDVYNAVQTSAAANGLTTPAMACYTDLAGAPLNTDGSLATNCASAAQVGGGTIPTCAACPGSSAAGVHVGGSRPFGTFFAGIVGLHGFTASAEATAIAGYVNAFSGPVIPITFPVTATSCDGTNKPISTGNPWPVGAPTLISIPLCNADPGNVGWLDWTPTSGGSSELADVIIPPPGNPTITTPHWYYVTATGNVNPAQVQTALDHWNGTTVTLPIFSHSCNNTPANIVPNEPGLVDDCVAGGGTLDGGTGSNHWYFLVGFAAFHLDHSWINGNAGAAECQAFAWYAPPGGNGGTSCLIGYFVGPTEAVSLGASVGAGGGIDNSASLTGVQLIR